MPFFKTSKRCFIGNDIRHKNQTFHLSESPDPLPDYLEEVELSEDEITQQEEQDEAEAQRLADSQHDVDEVTHSAPDFLDADKELSPQEKAAVTRKKNQEAKKSGSVETL